MGDDDARRHLRGKKRLAAALLLFAALAWCGLQFAAPAPWVGYLRAAAEAAMVGGLADWFAVTALFRRPLGLPLPHTNLIVANQRAIAHGIARYIEREFLRSDALVAQVRGIDFAAHLARFLDAPDNRARIRAELGRILAGLLASGAANREVLAAVAEAVRGGMKSADLRPGARVALRGLAESGLPAELVKRVAAFLGAWLAANPEVIRRKVREGSHWYLPTAVDDRLAAAFARGVGDFARALGDDASPEFARMRAEVLALLQRLEDDGRTLPRLFAALRKWSAENPAFPRMVETAVGRFAALLEADLKSRDSRLHGIFDLLIGRLARALATERVRARVNGGISGFLIANLGAWSDRIVGFVEATLMNQDARRFSDRIEIQVGADLQYIRLNGTFIGAGIGAFLHLVSQTLPEALALFTP